MDKDNKSTELVNTDKKLHIVSLAKSLNGDDVNVEDCIFKGKKKYYKEIKIN